MLENLPIIRKHLLKFVCWWFKYINGCGNCVTREEKRSDSLQIGFEIFLFICEV